MLTRHITDEGDRILRQNDFHEYTYDDQGNMTASKQYSIHDDQKKLQDTKIYAYDALNRLKEVRSKKQCYREIPMMQKVFVQRWKRTIS